ncbi:MAG: threonine synthase, partial [Acidimicrobiales bacterium]
HRAILADFDADRLDDPGTIERISSAYAETELVVDPHTAVGLHAANRLAKPGVPMVTLATADPAKFPDAVEQALGIRPELPAHVAEILTKPERFEPMANDLALVSEKLRSLEGSRAEH